MFVVLYKGLSLLQVVTSEMSCQVVDLVLDDWDSIASDDDAFHLDRADFCVPIVISDV